MNIKAMNAELNDLPEYSDAAVRLLLEVVEELQAGKPPAEIGARVASIGRLMERKI